MISATNTMRHESIVDAETHYDLRVEEGNDPFHDPPTLRAHMERFDGLPSQRAIGDVAGLHVLEIGIGTGRWAPPIGLIALVEGKARE